VQRTLRHAKTHVEGASHQSVRSFGRDGNENYGLSFTFIVILADPAPLETCPDQERPCR